MSRRLRVALSFAGLAVLAVTVTACTLSVGSGLMGSLGAALLAAGLLFGATSQAGCDTSPCLSPVPPDAAENEDGIGPCLGMALPDAGPDAAPGPDAGAAQAHVRTRAQAIDHYKSRLPADVVERLGATDPEAAE